MPVPAFDITKPKSIEQDAALAVDVLRRFKEGPGAFTPGDAGRVIEAIQALWGHPLASLPADPQADPQADQLWQEEWDRIPDGTHAYERARQAGMVAIERLMHVLDRDRYVVAYCLGLIETAVRGREWLLEGRGPYEWDDDRYREEFGDAIRSIREAAQPLKIVAWDKADCTRIEERVNAAKLAARALLARPAAPRSMIATEIWGDMNGWPIDAEFKVGDRVQKKGRASWRGKVVGWYRTDLTQLGYAVESAFEPGSVQIYPASALVAWDGAS